MGDPITHTAGELTVHTDTDTGLLHVYLDVDGAQVPLAVHKSGHFTGLMNTGVNTSKASGSKSAKTAE